MTKPKLLLFLSLLIIIFLLNACSENTKNQNINLEPSRQPSSTPIEWLVIKKDNEKGLVVNPIPKDFSSTGGIKEFYDAVWVSNFPDEVQVGQKVEVLFDGGIATSYPGQGRAKKVSILPSIKPEKAKMTEERVIRVALKSKETSDIKIFVVKDLKFDEKSHVWTIRFKDGQILDKQTEERSLQIQDK